MGVRRTRAKYEKKLKIAQVGNAPKSGSSRRMWIKGKVNTRRGHRYGKRQKGYWKAVNGALCL